ncbi:MAG TPA: hypothetical protein VLE89_01080 [Chlamydiales bacterium]|nr:hypothetical protein [Chlamydiales bacterium]
MVQMSIVNQAPNCCTNFAQSSKDAVCWLGRSIKTAGVATWKGVVIAAKAVAHFFAVVGSYIAAGAKSAVNASKVGLLAAKVWWHNPANATLIKQMKAAALGAVVAVGVTALICGLCCRKDKPEEAPAP